MSENQPSVQSMVEAVLFMHGAPVALSKIVDIISADIETVRTAVATLSQEYDARHAGLCVILKDDNAQIVTSAQHAEVIENFTRKELEGDLSQAALEVLAIIAYRGPLTKPDVEAVRGVNCSFTLRNLLLRGLIERIAHPTDKRTKLYRATFDFLRTLGLTEMKDLPSFEELAGDTRIDAILYSTKDSELAFEPDEDTIVS